MSKVSKSLVGHLRPNGHFLGTFLSNACNSNLRFTFFFKVPPDVVSTLLLSFGLFETFRHRHSGLHLRQLNYGFSPLYFVSLYFFSL